MVKPLTVIRCCVVLCALSLKLGAASYYVDAGRPSDAGDGLSWATAKKSIQAAINAAADGDSVVVTNGVYGHIGTDKMIEIRSVNGAAQTVIDGGGDGRCASMGYEGSTNATLTGFTLRNGRTGTGGGVLGGLLNRCIITNNVAHFSGGGADGSTLNSCLIAGNTATNGGAGAALCKLNSCTVVGNASGFGGSGVDNCVLKNCIIWDNRERDGTLNNYRDSWLILCCTAPAYSAPDAISDDPRFVDESAGDYRLRLNSPCLDAGDNGLVVGATDVSGNDRVAGGAVDLGAYEGGSLVHDIWVSAVGHGVVSPSGRQVIPHGGTLSVSVTPSLRPFLYLATNGVWATGATSFTWTNITAEGTLEAVFAGLCVDAGRPDNQGDGLSWQTAKRSIQAAIDVALDGEAITVTNGSYDAIDSQGKSVCLRSVNGAAVTVIDGGGLTCCAVLGERARMTGFTLRNGYAQIAGAVIGGTLDRCVLVGNSAAFMGGAASYSTLNACILSNNAAWSGGGAASCTLNACTLAENAAQQDGGGTYDCILNNCLLLNNHANSGGGSSGGTLSNCTLTRNTAFEGAGAYGGRHRNCILWDNFGGGVLNNYSNGVFVFSCTTPLVPGLGNVSQNPRFLDAASGDYRLKASSPCLDAGAYIYVEGESDLQGGARITGGAVDMGAIEGGHEAYDIVLSVAGHGTLSLSGTRVMYPGDSLSVSVEPGSRPFLHFLTNGVWATSDTTLVWTNIRADGTVTAVFGGLYVDASRPDDAGDGLSWQTAKRTLQAAVALSGDGDTIAVTNGVYAPISTANRAIQIRSVSGASVTVIDGGGTNRCATLGEEGLPLQNNTLLTGFTLRNGWAPTGNGGGVRAGMVAECRLVGNVSLAYGGGAAGSVLSGCELLENQAYGGGGASGCTLSACMLSNNTATIGGGSYEAVLSACTLSGNSAAQGAGSMYGTLNSCLLAGNSASMYGGGTSYGTLNNCTLANNVAGYGGSGAYSDLGTPCTLNNCIIWGNRNISGTLDNLGSQSGMTVRYSCSWPHPEGEGNREFDPLFVDAGGGDFRLRVGSPCARLGALEYVTSQTDLLGHPRHHGFDVDMGAYEGAVDGVVIAVRVQGQGRVSPGGTQVAVAGEERVFSAEPGPCAFRGFFTNGVFATAAREFVWSGISADATLTAVFDSTNWYVNASRSDDSGDGLSWGTAKRTLQAAVDCARTGDGVWVANGVYAPVLIGGRVLALRSVGGPSETVIDGGGIRRCVSVLLEADNNHTNTTLTGFRLRNGLAYDGGGSLGASLNQCWIDGCSAVFGGGSGLGLLSACTLTNNSSAYGGAVWKCKVSRSRLIGNAADVGGGASDSELQNCEICGNRAANKGGGADSSQLDHCTLSLNAAVTGGGVANSVMRNSVAWSNQAPTGANYDDTSALFYSCATPLADGEGNLSSDPLLVSAAKGNLRLSLNSPCINAGLNGMSVGEVDLGGVPRIVDGTVDMGAHESIPPAAALSCSNLVWTSGGDAYWFAQVEVAKDGEGGMQSGPVGDNQSTWIKAAGYGAGTLTFAWRTSSESRDYLRLYKDGQPWGAVSGTTVWQTVTLAVTNGGPHTFLWEYGKGKSGAAGADAAWLDQVVWSQSVVTVSTACLPAVGGSVTGGGSYTAGYAVTLVATPNTGWRFVRWENNETNQRREFYAPGAACTYTAYFSRVTLSLSSALDNDSLTWSTRGDAVWNGWALVSAHDGTDAAQSGVIGDLQYSELRATVTGPGTLSFWWRISCEEDFDYLDFAVDGATQRWLTGESGWQLLTLRLEEGSHVLSWTYWKDESLSEGDDAAWLDEVVWEPDVPALTGFARWAADKGLSGEPSVVFGQDRNGDGVVNGFEYAYGTNLTVSSLLLNIRMVGGHPMVETLRRDAATTNDVVVSVQGCTNLLSGAWSLPVEPATNTAGKPPNREWFVPLGPPPAGAWFRLRAVLQ
jgi:hypothetical protein